MGRGGRGATRLGVGAGKGGVNVYVDERPAGIQTTVQRKEKKKSPLSSLRRESDRRYDDDQNDPAH